MHAGLNAVSIYADPHICILVHKTAAGIEHVIIAADLGEALSTDIVSEVVGVAFNIRKAVCDDIAVCITEILTTLKSAANGVAFNIAYGVLQYLAHADGEYDAVINFDRTVKHLAVFVAVVGFALVSYETAAFADEESGFFIEVIPVVVRMVVFLMGSAALGNKAVAVNPICAFFKL